VPLPEGYLAAARDHRASRRAAHRRRDPDRRRSHRRWFAFQHAGIVPDAITVAKGIGGGSRSARSSPSAPPATCSTRHGSRQSARTAVADAVLGEIERAGLVDNARQRGSSCARDREIGSTLVEGCRGEGLLIGVALTAPVAGAVVAAAQQHGLIVNAANDSTIRIAPALTIGDVEIDEFIDLFTRALATVQDALLLDARPRPRRCPHDPPPAPRRRLSPAEQAEILDLAVSLKKDRWKLKPPRRPSR
jgi:acetylornithine aminotransferase